MNTCLAEPWHGCLIAIVTQLISTATTRYTRITHFNPLSYLYLPALSARELVCYRYAQYDAAASDRGTTPGDCQSTHHGYLSLRQLPCALSQPIHDLLIPPSLHRSSLDTRSLFEQATTEALRDMVLQSMIYQVCPTFRGFVSYIIYLLWY